MLHCYMQLFTSLKRFPKGFALQVAKQLCVAAMIMQI